MTKHLYICFLFSVVLLVQGQVIAQEKFLYVSVINANKSAVSGISITCTGCSTELVNQGSAKISLPLQTRPGDATFLRVVRRSVRNPEWIIVSPPDGKVFVPSFTGSNAITVIVAIKSYPQILRGPKAIKDKDIKAIVEKTLKNNRALDGQVSDQEFDLALKMQAKAFGVTPEEVVRAIHVWAAKVKDPYDKGLAALFDKKYAEATNLLTISYELRKESVDEFVNAAYFLGQSLWQQGKYKEAVEKLQQVVVFRKDDSGVLNWLGLGLSYSGNYPEAETIYRRALAVTELEFGKGTVETAIVLNNLGLVCRLQRKFTEAESLYNEALAINKKELGDEHPLTANSLNNLGTLFMTQTKYVDAERLLMEARAIREKKLGKDHPDTAITMDNLGHLYSLQGRYEEAEPLLVYALGVKEKTLGYDHPITGNSYGNLGSLYTDQGKYTEAVVMLEKQLAILEKKFSDKDSLLGTTLNNVAVAYHRQGKYSVAEYYYKRSIDICNKTSLDDCDMTFRNLAKLYTTQGKYDDAEPLFQQSLAIFERNSSNKGYVRIVFVLESYAELLRKTNREKEADSMETRAKEIRAKAGFYGKN